MAIDNFVVVHSPKSSQDFSTAACHGVQLQVLEGPIIEPHAD